MADLIGMSLAQSPLKSFQTDGADVPNTTVFAAKAILTMDPNCPTATHVAVRDGKILAVGDRSCADPWGGGKTDDRFGEAVIVPGLVEGHSHLMEGGLWRC
ncbi:hypothetical protein [Paracoccus sp. SSK6]|uniref:hypothetical protein n=1 Tax=Paracoccus sp. SSK6 TaxID=3143131 RepID=UPI003219C61A